ncbi:MAG: TonB-dependent receptor plug domain-containing protein, partial [Caulobacteraceae bacterium]
MIVRAKFMSWIFATSSAAALAAACPAWAASAPASQDEVEAVVVTGSAIRGTPENAAMPVEAINLEQLEKTGAPSNVDLIKRLTESGGVQGETNRNAPLPIGAASINLRSLGPGKTVVLFNNRRWGDQYSATVGVGRFNNIAQIPNAVIGRVEILKDGGNAIYGADAVGGIVNYISRKKFNGLELNANYRAISGEKGDRGASVLWGKTFDRGNVMIGLDYDHRSELKANARDWTQRPYLDSVTVLGYAWNASGSPGSYIVQDRRDNATGAPVAAFSSITTNQPATGLGFNRYAGDRQIGSTGLVRDKACTDLGGFAGFNTTSSPVCYYHPVQFDNLVEEQNTHSAYIEADYQVAPWLKWHGEGYYYTLDMPRIAVGASDPLFSYPIGQDGCSIAPTGVGTAQNCGGTAGYSVPGSNPAVADFLSKYNNINAAGTAYTPAQIAAITTGSGPGGAGSLGRVFLTGGVWRPFGMGGNPQTGGADLQHNHWQVFRTAQELSGTLPQVAGWDLSFSGAGTYQHTTYEVETRDMLVDRLQQALNGLGGAGCDTNPATPNLVEGGVPGVGACKWFNPFSSAIAGNPITGQTNPGYVAALANDPGMVQWLYAPLSLKRASTLWVGDFVLNGKGGLSLSGGPIAFALGGQYRWQQESELVNSFSDKGIQRYDGTTVGGSNPCPTVGVTDCSTASKTGAIVFNRSVGGVRKNSTRTYPAWGAFGEVNLPLLKTLTLDIAGRYERYRHDLTGTSEGVLVGAGSVKWQATPWVALRATGGNTF